MKISRLAVSPPVYGIAKPDSNYPKKFISFPALHISHQFDAGGPLQSSARTPKLLTILFRSGPRPGFVSAEPPVPEKSANVHGDPLTDRPSFPPCTFGIGSSPSARNIKR